MASMPTSAGCLGCEQDGFHSTGYPTIISRNFKFQKWPPCEQRGKQAEGGSPRLNHPVRRSASCTAVGPRAYSIVRQPPAWGIVRRWTWTWQVAPGYVLASRGAHRLQCLPTRTRSMRRSAQRSLSGTPLTAGRRSPQSVQTDRNRRRHIAQNRRTTPSLPFAVATVPLRDDRASHRSREHRAIRIAGSKLGRRTLVREQRPCSWKSVYQIVARQFTFKAIRHGSRA